MLIPFHSIMDTVNIMPSVLFVLWVFGTEKKTRMEPICYRYWGRTIGGTDERFIRRFLYISGAGEAVAAALDEVSPAVAALAHLHQASDRADQLHARPSVQARLAALAVGERAAGDGLELLLPFASAQMLAFHVTCRSDVI